MTTSYVRSSVAVRIPFGAVTAVLVHISLIIALCVYAPRLYQKSVFYFSSLLSRTRRWVNLLFVRHVSFVRRIRHALFVLSLIYSIYSFDIVIYDQRRGVYLPVLIWWLQEFLRTLLSLCLGSDNSSEDLWRFVAMRCINNSQFYRFNHKSF